MKKFWRLFCTTFFFTALAFLIVAAGVWRRLNIEFAYVKIAAGAILVGLFIAGGVALFRRQKGNAIINTIGGFLIILPSVAVIRFIFTIAVFRFSFIVYLFAILCAIIYAVAVWVVSRKAKREEKELNAILAETRKKENPE
ncbi:MAG: hypothetical protein V1761_04365 [bacterium]